MATGLESSCTHTFSGSYNFTPLNSCLSWIILKKYIYFFGKYPINWRLWYHCYSIEMYMYIADGQEPCISFDSLNVLFCFVDQFPILLHTISVSHISNTNICFFGGKVIAPTNILKASGSFYFPLATQILKYSNINVRDCTSINTFDA